MKKKGIYYLGRINKIGLLNHDLLVKTIKAPISVKSGQHAWTITDARTKQDNGQVIWAYGKLSKYKPDGSVKVVDEPKRSHAEQPEKNLLVADSSFIYLPSHSGIAFLNVWNHIEQGVFERRFEQLIRETNSSFFVDCVIEPISDLKTFITKLESLDHINQISAKVRPPNPLFGPAWKRLEEYVRRRKASEVEIKEKALTNDALQTNLVTEIRRFSGGQMETGDNAPDITDAAVLMAADGYGNAEIIGKRDGARVRIRTAETYRTFDFSTEPEPELLYEEANDQFRRVEKDRGHRHL